MIMDRVDGRPDQGTEVFRSFFRLGGPDRKRIEDHLGILLFDRMLFIVPALFLLAVYLLFTDVRLLQRTAPMPSYAWYLVLDAGFLLLQTAALAVVFRTHRRRFPPGKAGAGKEALTWNPPLTGHSRLIRIHALLCLFWAGLIAAAEQADTGRITTLIIAVLLISMLGSFRSLFLLFLYAVCGIAFIAGRSFFPALSPWTFSDLVPLGSLFLLGFVVSRTLYTASAEGIRSMLRLQEAKAQLERANRRLVEQNRSLREMKMSLVHQEKLASIGELSAGIVHEISNPLVFIKGNTYALREHIASLTAQAKAAGAAGADREERIAEIERIFSDNDEGYRRIASLLDSLRYFTYRSAEHRFEPYDLNRGIESTLRIARGRIEEAARTQLDLSDLPPVRCDAGAVNQVLMNIIMNAVQAIERERGETDDPQKRTIGIRSYEEDGNAVCEIRNDGPPIPPEVRGRIFEPFFSTRPMGTGMGIGLSICRDIVVRRHGGSLTLLDVPQTTFRIELPLHRQEP